MGKIIIVIAVVFYALLVSYSIAQAHNHEAQRFFSALPEVPLMAKMVEDENLAVSFDSPQGRVVEVGGLAQTDAQAVRQFYGTVLPQLGWSTRGRGYVRGNEALILDIRTIEGEVFVKITVSPLS